MTNAMSMVHGWSRGGLLHQSLFYQLRTFILFFSVFFKDYFYGSVLLVLLNLLSFCHLTSSNCIPAICWQKFELGVGETTANRQQAARH